MGLHAIRQRFYQTQFEKSNHHPTPSVLKDSVHTRYNVQSDGKRGEVISDAVFFVSCWKGGTENCRKASRGETFGRGRNQDSKEGTE